ncbi:MAG: hypothetical protein ABR543_04090 [Gemmatimonadaceae bacterium]
MNRAWFEVLLWSLAAAAGVGAVVGWRSGLPPAGDAFTAAQTAPREMIALDSILLADAARATVAGDLFRLERKPADVAFERTVEGLHVPPPPPVAEPQQPVLVLSGVIGGPPWEALLDGVPGRTGSVLVRSGDVFGTLTIASVGRDTVVVRGMDTTWVLTLKRSWQ